MSWGRGGLVGVRKEIWAQERIMRLAALLIEAECGEKHALGERDDLCPKCKEFSDLKRRKERERVL